MLKGPAATPTALDALLARAEGGEGERVHVFLGINTDALQSAFKLLDVIRHQLLLQRHGRGRIFQRAVIH